MILETIKQRLRSLGTADVIIAISITPIKKPPVVVLSDTAVIGNVWEGIWKMTFTAACIANSDVESLILSEQVREALDGWGCEGIDDIRHMSTIPQRAETTSPTLYTRIVSFEVTYVNLRN